MFPALRFVLVDPADFHKKLPPPIETDVLKVTAETDLPPSVESIPILSNSLISSKPQTDNEVASPLQDGKSTAIKNPHAKHRDACERIFVYKTFFNEKFIDVMISL